MSWYSVSGHFVALGPTGIEGRDARIASLNTLSQVVTQRSHISLAQGRNP